MKVFFYGDSVIGQKDGIVENFIELYRNDPSLEIEKLGMGGRHLFPTAICFIDEVIEKKPDYCFIAWFNDHHKYIHKELLIECLSIICKKLIDIQCMPIFLLLGGDNDRTTHPLNINRKNNIKEFCKDNNLPCLDILENDNFKKQTLNKPYLRDYVHTNELGSQLYADICKEFFENNVKNYSLNNIDLPDAKNSMYFNIKKRPLLDGKQYQDVFDKLVISGCGQIVGIEQRVGPYSGIVNITVDNAKSYKQKIWDYWCHYERANHIINIDKFERSIVIDVLKNDFDRSNCRQQLNWSDFPFKLKLLNIFYIGEINDILIDPLHISQYTMKSPLINDGYTNTRTIKKNHERKRGMPPPPPAIMV